MAQQVPPHPWFSENSIHVAGFTPKIINISSYVLNQSEISILAKGKKFTPTPEYSDLLGLKVDIMEFIRKIQLRELFGGNDISLGRTGENSVVKIAGKCIPHPSEETFLFSLTKEMKQLANNLHRMVVDKEMIHDNIRPDERRAMQRLSKNKNLVIKSADKGGGIVVMVTSYYKSKVETHLMDATTFEEVPDYKISKVISKVESFVLKYDKLKVLTRDESLYLRKFDCKTPNFFGVPKIHKSKKLNEVMKKGFNLEVKIPETLVDLSFRFINGEVSAPTCKLSELVDIILKPFLILAPSYIKDYTHFQNRFTARTLTPMDVENGRFVVCDVETMYPRIELPIGQESIGFWIDEHPEVLKPTRFTKEFVLEALAVVMTNSYFQFNDKHYKLKRGTATGTTVAPTYANLIMAYLEIKLYKLVLENFGKKTHDFVVQNWYRFLDDGFIFWDDTLGDYHIFVNLLNSLHPNIKFTHESSKEKISFLNILLYKSKGKVEMDIFYKKTDNHDYLPFKSCHPRHTTDNIPFTLARMVCSIVSSPAVKHQRLIELFGWLQNSGYPFDKICDSFTKVNSIDQKVLREKVIREKKDQLIFVNTFNPQNPQVFQKLMSYLKCLKISENEKYSHIFRDVSIIQSRRQPPNLGLIIQSSYFGSLKFQHGVSKCNANRCITCSYLEEGTEVFFHVSGVTIKIKHRFTCDSGYLLYKIRCKGCGEYYVGRTCCLKQRLYNHKFNVNNITTVSCPLYAHIATCARGHEVPFTIMPFYKIHHEEISKMASIERHYIDWLKPYLNTL